MFEEVSEYKISSKTCSNDMKVGFWMMYLNSFYWLLKFMKIVSNKRNWTCHFTIDTSTIHTDTNVIIFNSFLCKSSDVLWLASSSHSVHYQNYWFLMVCLSSSQPIQWNMTSISKKDSFSLERSFNLGRVKLIKWL
jgi:hypothetical protein